MTNKTSSSAWIVRFKPNPRARLRLFCFPHAGGGASLFRAWADELPAEIEVCAIQPPGREMRLQEQPFTRLEPLVEQLADVVAPYVTRPFAFFGHSLGALVCFELARRLRNQQVAAPTQLFIAARAAPHLPREEPVLHQLSDADLVSEICRRYDGIPQAVRQEAELMKRLLPAVRADLTVLETYTHIPGEPLECPFVAFGGSNDHAVRPEQLEPWRDHTRGPFTLHLLPGNHFFINSSRAMLLQAVMQSLSAVL